MANTNVKLSTTMSEAAEMVVVPPARQAMEGVMSILINSATKVLVQNITGREGTFSTPLRCSRTAQGGRGHSSRQRVDQSVYGCPVFDSGEGRREGDQSQQHSSSSFVPASLAADAIVEAADKRSAAHYLPSPRASRFST